jgi:uncharacterized protein YdeI (YjbR/CyaY-like superfamily)
MNYMWQKETEQLSKILLDCGLTEEVKWGKLAYTYEGKNVVVIQGFKQYFALLFLKGYLLKDPEGVLVKTGENTRVGRQIRFKDVREIVKLKSVVKSYTYQAIDVERSGAKDTTKKTPETIPEELQSKFKKKPAFKKAFNALTPGRQRAYLFHFSSPKQSKTRETRIEKYVSQIMDGVGLNDEFLKKKKSA